MYSRISIGNLQAYHMLMLPDKAISEDSFFSSGVWGACPPIMLPVYDDYNVLTAISTTLGSFSHHALSPCISSWTLPTYPFIYFGNIDLSTCRPSAIVNNKDPVDQHLHLHLYTLLILICRLVDLLMWTIKRIHLPSQYKEDPSPLPVSDL